MVTTPRTSSTPRQSSLFTNTSPRAASLQAEYFASWEFKINLLFSGLCGLHFVDTEIGQNQHYRKDCYQDPCPLAEKVVRDDRVWTHLDTVIENSNKAFQTIDFE